MNLSVLIPVYNAERYLRECLDSALAAGDVFLSSGNGREFSVRCCDDGSGDGSAAILREYADRHPNLSFVTQANAGVVAARNRLLDELPTNVDAFAFLDSDDCLESGIYAKLAEAMERTLADVAETEWDGDETILDDMTAYLLKRTSPGKHWINVINKLYSRQIVGEVRFREGLRFEEDYFFNFEAHRLIRRKVLVPGKFYTYRTNPDSATNRLNFRRYFESASRRIRLSCEEFLNAGRIPPTLEAAFRAELVSDMYRMCIRKNLKKNRDESERRALFAAAGRFLAEAEREYGLKPDGLSIVQRAIYRSCRTGHYHLALAIMRGLCW